jgi:O-antigen/teichoic acid export membrane protein
MARMLLQRLRAHAGIPLFREGYALIASSAITSVFGLAYWIVAARAYSPHIVGLNSAGISAMLFLSGLAQLNLSSALIRFLPVAGPKSRKLIAIGYIVPTCVASVVATIFVIGLDRFTDQLEFLVDGVGYASWFVIAVIAWNLFVLQDAVLTGLRRAIWVCADSALFSVARLVLLLVLAGPLPMYGIFASWTLAVAASVIPINALIFGRLLGRHMRHSISDGSAVSVRRLAHFAGLDYVGWLSYLGTTTLIPLMITARAGAADNAYFSLAWTLVVPLQLISSSMGMSMVVASASGEADFSSLLRRTLGQTLRLTVPLVLLGIVAAPYLLALFGQAYVDEGTGALRLLLLAAIPNVITNLYVYACRAQRRMRRVAVTLISQSALVFGLSFVLLDVWGVSGVAGAWLIGQASIAAVVLIRLIPGLIARPSLQSGLISSESHT